MRLIQELKSLFCVNKKILEFFCEVFEDNRSTIAVAESKKHTPRTKLIALKYHHFRRYVHDGTIKIHANKRTNRGYFHQIIRFNNFYTSTKEINWLVSKIVIKVPTREYNNIRDNGD